MQEEIEGGENEVTRRPQNQLIRYGLIRLTSLSSYSRICRRTPEYVVRRRATFSEDGDRPTNIIVPLEGLVVG